MTTSGGRKVRSFIAIPVPDQGIEALKDTIQKLESDIGRSVRWVRPKGIHLTLKFMGDIPAGTVEQVLEALPLVAARFPPIKLAISRLGIFPNTRRPRVLWAGLTGELEALSELQSAVDDMTGRLELPKEQRPFSPHLTLGRVRRETSESQLRKIGEIIADAAPPSAEPWTANTVNLMLLSFSTGAHWRKSAARSPDPIGVGRLATSVNPMPSSSKVASSSDVTFLVTSPERLKAGQNRLRGLAK